MNSLELIRKRQAAMSKVERKIAAHIISDPNAVINETITHLAARAGVSVASVVNFANSMGLRGFSELKINIAQHLPGFVTLRFDEVTAQDDGRTAMGKMIDNAITSFRCTYDAIGDTLTHAVALLLEASCIEVYGAGSSLPVAQDAFYRLMRLGIPVRHTGDPLLACLSASQLPSGSVALAVSHKGRTVSTLQAVDAARARGAKVIALTSFESCPLADKSDVCLVSVCDEAKEHREAVIARLTQLLILDSLCACIAAQKGPEGLARLDSEIEILELYRKE